SSNVAPVSSTSPSMPRPSSITSSTGSPPAVRSPSISTYSRSLPSLRVAIRILTGVVSSLDGLDDAVSPGTDVIRSAQTSTPDFHSREQQSSHRLRGQEVNLTGVHQE